MQLLSRTASSRAPSRRAAGQQRPERLCLGRTLLVSRPTAWARDSRLRAASTISQSAAADLAKQLLQAEQELQAMFQPGKPMPKAAVVAAKRSEVARLRAQLDGRMSTLEEDAQDPEEVEAARKAFEELEQYLRGPLENDDDEKLSQLESENAQLRILAHQLLLRQQQLEELALRYGVVIAEEEDYLDE